MHCKEKKKQYENQQTLLVAMNDVISILALFCVYEEWM